MVVHIYNPSHDEALACNNNSYCPSSAARRTAQRFWNVPRYWAAPDDIIIRLPGDGSVNGAEYYGADGVKRIDKMSWTNVTSVEPWGWDRHIVQVLLRLGAPEHLMPSDERLSMIRQLSSRQTAVAVLQQLAQLPAIDGVIRARSQWCRTEDEILHVVDDYGSHAVFKQPWSCSGRGVWRNDVHASLLRIRKTLRDQGAVEVEPLYECLQDFAMEFFADGCGGVRYEGVSVFDTHAGGTYAGNVIAPQQELLQYLQKRVDYPLAVESLSECLCDILGRVLSDHYHGPLGVDMMLTPDGIHPCIEVNLRNTMGRVAIFQASALE